MKKLLYNNGNKIIEVDDHMRNHELFKGLRECPEHCVCKKECLCDRYKALSVQELDLIVKHLKDLIKSKKG